MVELQPLGWFGVLDERPDGAYTRECLTRQMSYLVDAVAGEIVERPGITLGIVVPIRGRTSRVCEGAS